METIETRVYVTYETGTLAKTKGYNEHCDECYTVEEHGTSIFTEYSGLIGEGNVFWCYRPKQAELQKWLRDVQKIHVNPVPYRELTDNKVTGYWVGEIYHTDGTCLSEGNDNYSSYEEALERGLFLVLQSINI